MGPLPSVYISDYDVAHESHIKRANIFSTRFAHGTTNYIREGRGIIAANGDFWQDHRRFALTTLRNFGLGRNLMEEKIMEEYNYRFVLWKKNAGQFSFLESPTTREHIWKTEPLKSTLEHFSIFLSALSSISYLFLNDLSREIKNLKKSKLAWHCLWKISVSLTSSFQLQFWILLWWSGDRRRFSNLLILYMKLAKEISQNEWKQ